MKESNYCFLYEKPNSSLDDSSFFRLNNSEIKSMKDLSREEETKLIKSLARYNEYDSINSDNSIIHLKDENKKKAKDKNIKLNLLNYKTPSENTKNSHAFSRSGSYVDMNRLQLKENKHRFLRLNSVSKPPKLERSPISRTFISPSDNTPSSKNSSENFFKNFGDVLFRNSENLKRNNSGSSINKNKFSHDNDVIVEEDSFEKIRSSRIFWSKEKLMNIRQKILEYKGLIMKKTKLDFDNLKETILNGDKEKVIEIMHNTNFKKFYKLDLKRSDLLKFMIKNNQTNILIDVIKDKFYSFDNYMIFEYIHKFMIKNESKNKEDLRIISDIVNNQLYFKNHSKIIAWFLAIFEQYDLFRIISSSDTNLSELGKLLYEDFRDNKFIVSYSENLEYYYDVLCQCLENKLEDLAIATVDYTQELDNESLISTAISHSCTNFLKFVWELCFIENKRKITSNFLNSKNFKSHYTSFKSPSSNHSKNYNSNNSKNTHKMSATIYSINKRFNNGNIPFTLSVLVEKFSESKNKQAINEILNWRFLEKDDQLLEKLFLKKCFDEISALLFKKKMMNKWNLNPNQFKIVIEHEEFDLILFFLKIKHCRKILDEHTIQSVIVKKYIKYGSKLYYGAEMLSYVYKLSWDNELTKILCYNIQFTIKKREIVNCHSPILTCLLLAEFLTIISEVNLSHQSRCKQLVKDLIELSRHIQNISQDEVYIKFLMNQKDRRGRSAFQIASDYSFFPVLQTDEIGTIIGKKWNGKISHNGFFSVSSLHRFLKNNNISQDPLENFDRIDKEKTYFYQLTVWTNSCSLRFFTESISLVSLIVIYNLYIYLLISEEVMMVPYSELFFNYKLITALQHMYTIFSILMALNILNQVLFCFLTKRRIKIDFWQISDIIVLIFVYLLYLDIPKMYNEDYNNPSNLSFFLRAIILCINNFFVWIRIVGILLTFKQVGPMIRMIYRMSVLLSKYLILYGLFIICSAAVFSSIFHRYNKSFSNFSRSIFFLIGGFIQNFNLKDFRNFVYFGEILLGLFITFSGILLINLLIAMLNSIYERMNSIVDASHRSVLISYYERYKWDEKYGYLIFLTTPLNILNLFTFPISHFLITKKYRREFNIFVLKIYFLFYFALIFVFFLVYSLTLLPFCYIKGIITYFNLQLQYRINPILKCFNIGKWIVLGIPYLFYIYLCDIYDILSTIYIKNVKHTKEVIRLKNLISTEDVLIFLQFIHSHKGKDQADLHIIFQEYLSYEQKIKAEKSEHLKEHSQYLNKLIKHNQYKKSKTSYASLMVHNKEDHSTSLTGNYTKKNLIIIEILENFSIEDYIHRSNHLVDIGKIRMLLPKTMNIDSSFMKRLLYSDIGYMNRAINNLKMKKDIFHQYILANRIISTSIRIDKEIDIEISKIYRRRSADLMNKEFEDKDEETNQINNYRKIEKWLEQLCEEFKSKLETYENNLNKGFKSLTLTNNNK